MWYSVFWGEEKYSGSPVSGVGLSGALGPLHDTLRTMCYSSEDRILLRKLTFITYAAQGFQGAMENYWLNDNIGTTLVPPQSEASPQTTVPFLASDIVWGWNEGQGMLEIALWERDGRKDYFPFKFQLEVLKSEAQNHCEQLFYLKTYVSLFHTFWWYERDKIPNTVYLSRFYSVNDLFSFLWPLT